MEKTQLKSVPFFSTLKKKEMQLVAQQCDELDVSPGKALARQGDLGDEFFVIEEGTAEVTRDGEKVAELGPGDFFGELAALDWGAGYGYARLATVTATSAMRLAAFAPAHLDVLIRIAPSAAAYIEDALRVRRATV
jgi:CRP-like cAMP-binding protein